MAAINATEITDDYLLLRDVLGRELKITRVQIIERWQLERQPNRKLKVLQWIKEQFTAFFDGDVDASILGIDFDDVTGKPARLKFGNQEV